ncbi:MAG: FAD binding domain-containing protein [Flavobacteriales bacterium]|jgi:4-hydroxybenzoyl-CoA reductase subunit beta|nr:FAD binding domain-containing protein [Flavobacteriales bacterium]
MVIEKTYLIPTTITEALEMAKANNDTFKYLAGGTDVMVNRFQGNETSPCLIDISKLEELKGIRKEGGFLRIGALEPLEDLKRVQELKDEFPLLIEAALSVGAPLLRKTATIGGNVLCENRCLYYNQSEWWREAVGYCLKCEGDICIATQGKKACFSELVSDTAPALIAMEAEIELLDVDGSKRIPLMDIYTGDGVKPRNISPTAILTAIFLPLNKGFKGVFNKVRERESLEFTSLTSAVTLDKDGNIRIVLSGVDPKPVVVLGKNGDDRSELIKKAIKGARAIDNDMYSRKYRREMIGVYLERSFGELGVK